MVAIGAIGKNVVANGTEEVGQRGVTSVFVILVGGIGCIGANLTGPVCRLYGVPHAPGSIVPPTPGSGAAATRFTFGGPAVPTTAAFAVATSGGKLPVIPARVKRSE